ncbi:MAG: hypothetical protein ABJK11_08005 [Balneola sp.]
MGSILLGNGINIQFGGKQYFNSNIIKRAINNILTEQFDRYDYPQEILQWVYLLNEVFSDILKGEFDKYAYLSFEKDSLNDLKKRYNRGYKYEVYEIGLEDYFLIHDLFCSKNKIHNPESFEIRESLKRLFADSIFNSGSIQHIYKNFPEEFKSFLLKHDQIFTTNYDLNLDQVVNDRVIHLHGNFTELSEVYNVNSFRNQISDTPAKDFKITESNRHLYSNIIMSYGGYLKEYGISLHKKANSGIDKFAKAYKNNSKVRKDIEAWKNAPDELTRRLYEGVLLKVNKPELNFNEPYGGDEIKKIAGSLKLLGLSPNNDIHLFSEIVENNQIDKVEFFYFDPHELDIAKKLFQKKKIIGVNVQNFWESII